MLNRNPFKYGTVVTGADFCERPQLIDDLISHIRSGQNMVVEGERRTGKTSAIMQAIQLIKGFKGIYIDLFFISSVEDLYKRILAGLIKFESQSHFIEKVFRSLTHLRPNMTIDPFSGLPSFSFEAGKTNVPQSISGLMGMILELSQKKNLCVVMDEFQSILEIEESQKVLAAMRSEIQFQSQIPYIFAGSVQHQMSDLFHHPDSAFYKAAIPVQVAEIEPTIFGHFIISKFKKGKRTLEQGLVEEIQALANGTPGDVQQLNAAIWDCSSPGDLISKTTLIEAIKLIHRREEKGYEQAIELLTPIQKRCLFTFARFPQLPHLSKEFIETSGVKLPATVSRSFKKLIKINVLLKQKNKFRFVNPFLRYWILNKGL